jgi:hypothetical protein
VSVVESAVAAIGSGVRPLMLGTVTVEVMVITKLPIVSVATTLMLLLGALAPT